MILFHKIPATNRTAESEPCIRWFAALKICLLILAATSCRKDSQSSAEPEVTAPKFVMVDQTTDLRAWLDDEIRSGAKKIVIPPGRYRVDSTKGAHLTLSGLRDVEIDATHVEMTCTSTSVALKLDDCERVSVRGLTIDYNPLPFTQGSIVAMAPDKSWLEFEVADGYPEDRLNERVQIYDPKTRELRRGDARWSEDIKAVGARRYRVGKAQPYKFIKQRDTEQVGDILVTSNYNSPVGSHAVVATDCTNLRLEGITIYSSPCFGFLERSCNATTYLHCKIDRRAPDDDPVKRAQPRMRSLNADAFHSKYAVRGPAIVACTAFYQGDDCVNINGNYYYIAGANGRQLRIAALKEPTIRTGDQLEFLPFSGVRPPDNMAVDLQPDPMPVTATEAALIFKLSIREETREAFLNGKAKFYTLTLAKEVDLAPGSLVCSGQRVGNDFSVRNCDFGHNRSRGILIKASKGEVSGNRITASRMAAVLISPEFWWLEAACSSHVLVADNVISGCLESPVQINAAGGSRQILPAGAHRNITLRGNRISDSVWPLIHVTSTSGLVIEGNSLPKHPPSFQPSRNDGAMPPPVLLEKCETQSDSPW